MVKTVTLNTDIPANWELRVTLPADVPTGSAAIVIMISPSVPPTSATFSDLLNSKFLGMWGGVLTSRLAWSSHGSCGQKGGTSPPDEPG